MDKLINKLSQCFPKMYINNINEAIIEPKNNIYFRLADVKDERDIKIKLVMWCSRLKGMSKQKKQYLLDGFNKFCGTNLSIIDMHDIYCGCGNGCNKELSENLVDSNFNMNEFPRRGIASWFKGNIQDWERSLWND